ncbi:MAG: helicase-related protein, partial [Candidatus Micrarchaeota archaeon]|nr:helicase-related protein [Candidatus Micrarchaeota archaeon]
YLRENLHVKGFLDCSKGYEEKRRVLWEYRNEDIENSVEMIVKEKNMGKKVLVIVNTVEKANNLGKKLEDYYKLNYGKDFIVFHARSTYLDRKKKEEWLNKNRERPHITIATQVCEISLDLSYDFLFTQLASVPAIVQRFGRVNRRGEKTEEINAQIFKPCNVNLQNYPYSESDLKIAEEIVIELEGKILKNEGQLIEKINLAYNYEDLLKEIRETRKHMSLKYWETLLKFFYSFDINNEKLSRVLNYREGFTVLVIPHPDCTEDQLSEYIAYILSKAPSHENFEEWNRWIAEIKELAVPIPFWWLKKARVEQRVFPIAYFDDRIYTYKYGFHMREM